MTASSNPPVARLTLSGFLSPGEPHHRKVLYEEVYRLLPKEPDARVCVYAWEIGPGRHTAWHIHNGAAFMLVTEGRIAIEFQDENKSYTAGDVYPEPIGVVHRAINPDPGNSVCGVAFIATPADREHVVNINEPW
ncbi:MAG TPA: cupin domain-containing protein [Solirubrobacteraceae bacterium]|jgi:quercetin dioxygenase-like cupin family protein